MWHIKGVVKTKRNVCIISLHIQGERESWSYNWTEHKLLSVSESIAYMVCSSAGCVWDQSKSKGTDVNPLQVDRITKILLNPRCPYLQCLPIWRRRRVKTSNQQSHHSGHVDCHAGCICNAFYPLLARCKWYLTHISATMWRLSGRILCCLCTFVYILLICVSHVHVPPVSWVNTASETPLRRDVRWTKLAIIMVHRKSQTRFGQPACVCIRSPY